ncbi:hypothetical protein Drose_04465 [Dactylosporangium roseum]|uniref:Uncharacterized protein n=1 Tax=Dactylosporangium roseum TaxID=47989 RepID=A0ABY5Z950_9ACTN|nr:hypothetical protein [Dactylosporangium roseum]UWZ37543.1 hypothetical protein Drose_04465 [Dactylosporangium roseum]
MSNINPDTAYSRVYGDIARERAAQDAKWGEQNHPDGTAGPGRRAAARSAKLWTNSQAAERTLAWADVLEEEVAEALAEDDPAKLRAELVQVAAVAAAWIEAIDRRSALLEDTDER